MRDVHIWVPWALEYAIGSAGLSAAGTIDALGILQMKGWPNPLRVGIDWKTGQKRKQDQTKNALYDVIMRREMGLEMDAWLCVYLGKKEPGASTDTLDCASIKMVGLREEVLDKCQE